MKIRFQPSIFWWLHPVPTVLMALAPFVLFGHLMSGQDYVEFWRTEKYLDRDTAITCGSILAAFLAGSFMHFLFRRRRVGTEREINPYRLEKLFLVSFAATTLGYILWASVCAMRGIGPQQVIAVFRGDTGAVYAIRELGETIPGLTTMTEFGMATAVFGAMLWNRRRSRYVAVLLAVLLLMAMVRAVLWSERLATIEIIIPLLIALLGRADLESRPLVRRVAGFAPLAACAGLYVYFTVSESVRSWGHYSQEGGSLWYFSWMRLCGYYITALNNGALAYKSLGVLPFPYTIFEIFWKFPGMNLVLPYNDIFSVDPYGYQDSLKSMANPEFNNPSGIFPYVWDFGPIGACIFFFGVGWLSTAAYAAFRAGTLTGLLNYPLMYISLLEISRVSYLTSSRSFPSWALLLIGWFLLKRRLPGHRLPGLTRRETLRRGRAAPAAPPPSALQRERT